ncbi:hypothetical protein AGR3A_Cc200041 [Agrobacterium tomkonis CFBP 6623]|uniref:Uncharacterized protein n=1 Tax=Agrobacterium tomkonis CFBP 6623 TaxID=1183432 RepID=A0A1S7P8P7_9HYPH|nr:hypothetical protein AGR3A_Cc200041 [Agrobacterium tomkonis CFBP 6623]
MVASALRHPGLDPGSSAIKSLIAKDSFFTAQTRRGWMPDLVRHDGGRFLRFAGNLARGHSRFINFSGVACGCRSERK